MILARKFEFGSQKKSEKVHLLGSKKDFFEVDTLSGAHIEMFSNKEIVIEGCLGVLEYNEEYVKLNLGKGSMLLCGRDFDIYEFENKSIRICGFISNIEFCV